MVTDDGVRGWGPELRVENRRAGGGGGRSKWLRDGKSEWVSPALNVGRNFGGNGNKGSSMQKEFQKTTNDGSGSGSGEGSKEADKANDEEINSIKSAAAFFQNPQLYFPVKVTNHVLIVKMAEVNTDEVMGDVLTVEAERKKRQRAHADEALSEEISSHALDTSGALVQENITQAEVMQEGEEGAVKNVKNIKSFLSVGPVRQAYREP